MRDGMREADVQTDANGPRPRQAADEDMSAETLTQRMNDAIRMQKRLHTILRSKEAT
jgi:hypothetical protein